jgi:hypothetical protein
MAGPDAPKTGCSATEGNMKSAEAMLYRSKQAPLYH